MFQASYDDFCELWTGGKETIVVEGFVLNGDGELERESRVVERKHFVTQEGTYYPELIKKMNKFVKK